MFLFSSAYQDVASLGNYVVQIYVSQETDRSSACLPHYTSGQTYFYPAFNAARSEDAIKFAHEFGEVLAMPIMLEAVQRVRASRGTTFGVVVKHLLTTLFLRFTNGVLPWEFLCEVD